MARDVIEIDKPWVRNIPFALGVATAGRLLYTSGITARNPDGAVVGAGNIRKQIEQCFENVGDVLRAAGADFGDVVKWTMYTTDIDGFGANADVWHRYFVNKPASTLVEVSRLVHPDMMVEIEAVAVLP